MSIIYSRPRLRFPKFVVYNNRGRRVSSKRKKRAQIIIVVFIAFLTVKLVIDAVEPVFNTLCENKALSLATIISNNKATEIMKEHKYEELFEIEKNEDETVALIKANVILINQITSEIAVKIQEEINKQGRDNVGIALRYIYRNKALGRARTNN